MKKTMIGFVLLIGMTASEAYGSILYSYDISERSKNVIFDLIIGWDHLDMTDEMMKETIDQDYELSGVNSMTGYFINLYNNLDSEDFAKLRLKDDSLVTLKKRFPKLDRNNKDHFIFISAMNAAGLREYIEDEYYYIRFIKIMNYTLKLLKDIDDKRLDENK